MGIGELIENTGLFLAGLFVRGKKQATGEETGDSVFRQAELLNNERFATLSHALDALGYKNRIIAFGDDSGYNDLNESQMFTAVEFLDHIEQSRPGFARANRVLISEARSAIAEICRNSETRELGYSLEASKGDLRAFYTWETIDSAQRGWLKNQVKSVKNYIEHSKFEVKNFFFDVRPIHNHSPKSKIPFHYMVESARDVFDRRRPVVGFVKDFLKGANRFRKIELDRQSQALGFNRWSGGTNADPQMVGAKPIMVWASDAENEKILRHVKNLINEEIENVINDRQFNSPRRYNLRPTSREFRLNSNDPNYEDELERLRNRYEEFEIETASEPLLNENGEREANSDGSPANTSILTVNIPGAPVQGSCTRDFYPDGMDLEQVIHMVKEKFKVYKDGPNTSGEYTMSRWTEYVVRGAAIHGYFNDQLDRMAVANQTYANDIAHHDQARSEGIANRNVLEGFPTTMEFLNSWDLKIAKAKITGALRISNRKLDEVHSDIFRIRGDRTLEYDSRSGEYRVNVPIRQAPEIEINRHGRVSGVNLENTGISPTKQGPSLNRAKTVFSYALSGYMFLFTTIPGGITRAVADVATSTVEGALAAMSWAGDKTGAWENDYYKNVNFGANDQYSRDKYLIKFDSLAGGQEKNQFLKAYFTIKAEDILKSPLPSKYGLAGHMLFDAMDGGMPEIKINYDSTGAAVDTVLVEKGILTKALGVAKGLVFDGPYHYFVENNVEAIDRHTGTLADTTNISTRRGLYDRTVGALLSDFGSDGNSGDKSGSDEKGTKGDDKPKDPLDVKPGGIKGIPDATPRAPSKGGINPNLAPERPKNQQPKKNKKGKEGVHPDKEKTKGLDIGYNENGFNTKNQVQLALKGGVNKDLIDIRKPGVEIKKLIKKSPVILNKEELLNMS